MKIALGGLMKGGILFLLTGFALVVPISGFSQVADPTTITAIQELQNQSNARIRVVWDKDLKRVRTLDGKLSESLAGTPQEAATQFLKRNGRAFHLNSELTDLRTTEIRDTGGGGKKIKYEQVYEGLPIFDGGIEVHIAADNSIDLVHNYYVPGLSISVNPILPETHAVQIGKQHFVATCLEYPSKYLPPQRCLIEPLQLRQQLHGQLGIFQNKLVYRFTLDITSPRKVIEYTVDANSGEILNVRDLVRNASGTGKVFDPNPIVTLHPLAIVPTDNNNKNSVQFNKAYVTGTLNDITDTVNGKKHSFSLVGPYVDVTDSLEAPFNFSTTAGRALVSSPTFDFTRDKAQFEHVMVYYHIDTNQRFIQGLGFTDIFNRTIRVDPHGLNGADNSHYVESPQGAGYLAFGDGGVDDAEDADIILHEYGHAIQDNQAPGAYGACSTESGAMSEGFGDYWAVASSTLTQKISAGYTDLACVGSWDAAPGCLRRLDSTKRYKDAVGECHADGEIWSGALWDLFQVLGQTQTSQLVLKSHFNVPLNPTFSDGATALLKADEQLYASAHRASICKAMTDRGIIVDQCLWEAWGVTLQQNHPWNLTVDVQPIDGILTSDTRIIPKNGGNAAIGLSTVVIPSLPASRLVIKMRGSSFYNIAYSFCNGFGGDVEYAQITLHDTSNNSFNVKVRTSPRDPLDSIFWGYIQVSSTFSTYELPITGLTANIARLEVSIFANRADLIVCGTNDLQPNPHTDAYFALDIDYIDLR